MSNSKVRRIVRCGELSSTEEARVRSYALSGLSAQDVSEILATDLEKTDRTLKWYRKDLPDQIAAPELSQVQTKLGDQLKALVLVSKLQEDHRWKSVPEDPNPFELSSSAISGLLKRLMDSGPVSIKLTDECDYSVTSKGITVENKYLHIALAQLLVAVWRSLT